MRDGKVVGRLDGRRDGRNGREGEMRVKKGWINPRLFVSLRAAGVRGDDGVLNFKI